ncbi:MAG: hypothetical protein EOM14_08140 [Clostridia bacterium]|nr:hypothetical protein [Clostridia bacterium]
MIIHKMTASFGILQNDTLELGDGLNIVHAPNERGKSTWCGFIRAMLYGIDSTAREKGGIKPDKIKFAPWSGAPMAGSMDIEYEGAGITLYRKGRGNAPMRDFTATVTGTSETARNIDPSAVGETLLGVSKDVFERSAFIGQGKMTVGGNPELEKRISAIVQTGEEKSSVTEAEERLKAAIRRRRYNKSGRLSEIERKIEEIRESLAEGERETYNGEELKKAKAAAVERRDSLLGKVAEIRKLTRRETLEKLSDSRSKVKTCENEYHEISVKLEEIGRKLDEGVFGKEDPEKCRQRLNEDEIKLTGFEKEAKKGGSPLLNAAVLTVVLIATAVFATLSYLIPAAVLGVIAIVQIARLFAQSRRRRILENEKGKILSSYNCQTAEEVERVLSEHESLSAEYTGLAVKLKQAAEKLDKVNINQTELESELLKDLDFSESGSEAVRYKKLLEEAETDLRNIREEGALWEGRQSVLKDPVQQKSILGELMEEHEKLTEEYDALLLAVDTLKEAGDEIAHRITPRLSSRTAEIFAKLTGSRYDAILLDRELKAAARPQGDAVARDTAFLSTGTVDQLYLAVRLAICELALPEEKSCPLILDDALANFDDERCERALELLCEIAKDRQIVLFTCHGREAAFMQKNPDIRIVTL